MTNDDLLDAEITPHHEQLAARLCLALVDQDPDRFDAVLREVDAGGCAFQLAALLARNTAATLVTAHGPDIARVILEKTITDADEASGDV